MQYIHNEQHYIDRYDVGTIEECLYYYNNLKHDFLLKRKELKNLTDEQFDSDLNKCLSYTVNIISGERFRHKSETIKEWMEKDRKMQDLQDNTLAPNMSCPQCHFPMQVVSRDLMDSYEDTAYMLFIYECVKCGKRKSYNQDGKEWIYQAPKCPNCGNELESDIKIDKKKDTTTFISSCTHCKYHKEDVDDHKKFQKEQADKTKREKQLLEQYRKNFCWDEKKGFEYITSMDNLKRLNEELEERKKKEKDPVYQKAMHLTKIKVNDLEKLLSEAIEKHKYTKLLFGQPEIQKVVIIPFTAQDSDSDRKEKESILRLKKVINSALEGTNWKLMSEGISYRMGYVYGRLKGVDQEDDLMEIVR